MSRATFSRIKWCLMSTCLVRALYPALLASAIAPWLSSQTCVAPTCSCGSDTRGP
ncbi:hypothetical protein PR002_g23219 [Phytophthora rubi]|uniref:RxLR effector protein n=1 Tax=Phytophthora rubi TaxID=129364 RepID=A0A6A3ITW8_9STRA|nr:hypothetical protein PR002_g23219 [Phytophthora rubi]